MIKDDNTTRRLCGYELITDLNFNKDQNVFTIKEITHGDCYVIVENVPREDFSGYSIDADDVNTLYFQSPGAWIPIGTQGNPFTAIFEGGGHVIKNFYIKSNIDKTGLFGQAGMTSIIPNIGLVSGLNQSFSTTVAYIGALVGYNQGTITSSYWNTDASQTVDERAQSAKAIGTGIETGIETSRGLSKLQLKTNNGANSPIGLVIAPLETEIECTNLGANWETNPESCDYVDPWDLRSVNKYPGILIGVCSHHPIEHPTTGDLSTIINCTLSKDR